MTTTARRASVEGDSVIEGDFNLKDETDSFRAAFPASELAYEHRGAIVLWVKTHLQSAYDSGRAEERIRARDSRAK